MRLSLVLSIFGMLAAMVPTRLDIIGTIECQAAPPWCYTIHILDATFNTVANSFSACELTNNYKKFRLKNYQPWGGIGDIVVWTIFYNDTVLSKRGQNRPQQKYHRNFDSERLGLNSDSFNMSMHTCKLSYVRAN
ncbi:hypothetical protein L3Y34_012889 [Caenorhabditis briggsae]|uniref:Uncharacterized protein n=1 Tax=Caenorhabditis briggsae TaxID=6238 RepID=A0AAE8ZWZ2_CAEBR|nr:hypothetical protein L3Y34_012889 [Caenorhabditis briggsae]